MQETKLPGHRTALESVPMTSKIQLRIWGPIGVTLVYPFMLNAFHALVTDDHGAAVTLGFLGYVFAALLLSGLFAVPGMGMILACRRSRSSDSLGADVRVRRLALFIVAAPTLYCFIGVNMLMLGVTVPDQWTWVVCWLLLGCILTLKRSPATVPVTRPKEMPALRVAHGVAGVIVLLFVFFHLFNHLFGLISPQAHTAVMDMGRKVYRSSFVEPVLIAALLFQVASGLRLAWTWSVHNVDPWRIFQLGSGFFLAVFILGHMNAVFIFARTVLGIDTGWAFASGDPVGMIHDPWGIRLLPHYAIAVFFVLAHLVSGLRVVLLAHGLKRARVNRLWWTGAALSAAVSLLIMLGMAGLRFT